MQSVADDATATLGSDKFGNVWSARINPDGTQTWVQSRNGVIINAGVNQTPRVFNPQTGLRHPSGRMRCTMPEPKLSIREAYLAMYAYLEGLYEETKADYLGGLLGGMSLLEDELTADPAAWRGWIEAVAKVRRGDVDAELGLHD